MNEMRFSSASLFRRVGSKPRSTLSNKADSQLIPYKSIRVDDADGDEDSRDCRKGVGIAYRRKCRAQLWRWRCSRESQRTTETRQADDLIGTNATLMRQNVEFASNPRSNE